jgi:hypothetical protein
MTVVYFHVQLGDQAEAEDVARELEQRLGALDAVESVHAEPSEPQVLAEIATMVAAAVVITRGGRDIVMSVRETVDELRHLVESWRKLRRTIFIEVDGKELDVRDVGDEEIERLAS